MKSHPRDDCLAEFSNFTFLLGNRQDRGGKRDWRQEQGKSVGACGVRQPFSVFASSPGYRSLAYYIESLTAIVRESGAHFVVMPAKRSRAQIGAAPIQTFFKTRRKASYVSGRTRRAKTKGAAVSVHHKPCDAHSSEEHREESKCFVCDEQLGTVVCCDTAQCNRVAHPACVGLDMELYRQRQRRQGVGRLPSTGVSEGAPSGAGSVSALDESGKFLCDRCTPDSRDGAKYNTLVRHARKLVYYVHPYSFLTFGARCSCVLCVAAGRTMRGCWCVMAATKGSICIA